MRSPRISPPLAIGISGVILFGVYFWSDWQGVVAALILICALHILYRWRFGRWMDS